MRRLRRVDSLRLLTAALPSAKIKRASGVEQPRASMMGTELLLFLCVGGRSALVMGRGDGGEEWRLFIVSGCGP